MWIALVAAFIQYALMILDVNVLYFATDAPVWKDGDAEDLKEAKDSFEPWG